jgi:hypothetical protein
MEIVERIRQLHGYKVWVIKVVGSEQFKLNESHINDFFFGIGYSLSKAILSWFGCSVCPKME